MSNQDPLNTLAGLETTNTRSQLKGSPIQSLDAKNRTIKEVDHQKLKLNTDQIQLSGNFIHMLRQKQHTVNHQQLVKQRKGSLNYLERDSFSEKFNFMGDNRELESSIENQTIQTNVHGFRTVIQSPGNQLNMSSSIDFNKEIMMQQPRFINIEECSTKPPLE